jgi:hypothetical protein
MGEISNRAKYLHIALSGVALFCVFFSISFPWYYYSFRVDSAMGSCNGVILYHWFSGSCIANKETSCGQMCSAFEDDIKNWRKLDYTSNEKRIYDVAFSFMFYSLLLFAVYFVTILLRLGFNRGSPNLRIILALGIASLTCLTLAIIIFGAGIAPAIKRDDEEANMECPKNSKDPCNSFFGNISYIGGKDSWGGAG